VLVLALVGLVNIFESLLREWQTGRNIFLFYFRSYIENTRRAFVINFIRQECASKARPAES